MPRRLAAALLVALLPLAAAEGLARVTLGGSLTRSIPYVSDEVAYWSQIATFAAAGFHGGYATINERPARASFSHFGPNGPVFSLVYGAPARLTGWHAGSAPWFGAAFWVAAAALSILVLRPPLAQMSLLLATFWPIVLAAPNTMQEPLHFAFGCALAVFAVRLLAEGPTSCARVASLAAALPVVAVASLVRPVWGLVAVGVGWQMARHRGSRWGAGGLVAGLAVCVLFYVAFNAMAAPYPSAAGGLDLLARGPLANVTVLTRAIRDTAPAWLAGDAEPLERFFRLELLAVAVLCTWSAWRHADAGARRVAAAMAATLWLVLLANLALRNTGTWQDYRTATPVLLTAVVAAAAMRLRWTWAVVAANLLVTPLAVATFTDFHGPRFDADREPGIERFAAAIDGAVRFDPSLGGWGNTLLVGVDRYGTELMGLPHGVAISAVFDWKDVASPIRSRYLLLTADEAETLAARMRLEKLRDTPLGGLYENPGWSGATP